MTQFYDFLPPEAGKLALNFVKQQSLHGEEEEEQEPEVDSAIETVVGDAGSQVRPNKAWLALP